MKNRWFLLVPLVIIITLISTGCGVSQSKYDAVAVELNLVKQDKQALQTKLDQAQSQLTDAKTDVVRAQVQLETTQVQLQTAQSDLKTTQGQLQAAQGDRQSVQTQLQQSQSELAQAKNDLQSLQAQVQSLQNNLNTVKGIPAKALSYAEFMDILMFEAWMAAGVTPNFTFSSTAEYFTALRSRANSIGDATLIGFVNQIEAGPLDKNTWYSMYYYCLAKVEAILK
jgi:myosin heavy subunit